MFIEIPLLFKEQDHKISLQGIECRPIDKKLSKQKKWAIGIESSNMIPLDKFELENTIFQYLFVILYRTSSSIIKE